jgi:transposase
MYPLLTNARDLTPREVLEGHTRRPAIDKRFEQLKSAYEIAPVSLKNEGRIETFFFLHCLALLVEVLLEREVRRAMRREGIRELPLYPEARRSRKPTVEQILRFFSLVERHALLLGEEVVGIFEPQLIDLQKQVLHLLGVPEAVYRSHNSGQ